MANIVGINFESIVDGDGVRVVITICDLSLKNKG